MSLRNTKPEFSKVRVNKAGENVRKNFITSDDIEVIENWRAAHNKILNDWQATLRGRCKGKNIVFAQRLKRRHTIFDKLRRQPEMQLARMHDIAGCRLIFENIEELYLFRQDLHSSWMKHIRRKSDITPYPYDYIEHPHPDKSGYRGVHDIYQYCARPGRDTSWDKLLVEIQYRTRSQHAWATANEIAGSITGNQSKFGRGNEEQKEFFRLASEIIARSEESRTSCYPEMSNKDLLRKFNEIEKKIRLLNKLKNIRIASEHCNFLQQNIILIYNEAEHSLKVNSYHTLPMAQHMYFKWEKELGEGFDIVLVRAPSQESLRHAYKNYFSDTKDFTRLIDAGLRYLAKNSR